MKCGWTAKEWPGDCGVTVPQSKPLASTRCPAFVDRGVVLAVYRGPPIGRATPVPRSRLGA